ncbi:hypothetical protein [Sneathiella sp.]|uniref:hypothetical protein n=1 Tax=Sneathiella sp. TaxID=1964365 RepID=UPI0035633182
MSDRPDFLTSGDEARLFPVLAETSKEKRVASIFLAVLTQIPALAEEVLKTVGIRVGQRTKIEAFTEVVLSGETDNKCRPDGLIVVNTGRGIWTALVEAKIGKAKLDVTQVQRYLDLAKANKIDAVITISNEFVSRADNSPISVPKNSLRKVDLFHWSWSWLATACEILDYQKIVEDTEQNFLLKQFNHFLAHPATGVERYTQMGARWKDVVQAVSNNETLQKNAPEVEEAVTSWFAEERDLCLHMCSHIGREVSALIERKLVDDPAARIKQGISDLIETQSLSSAIRVPDCASDITVTADFARRTVSASMTLKAPGDKVSTKARVNWVLRMLKDDDNRLLLRALWPGRAVTTTKDVASLRSDPTLIQNDNPSSVPRGFEVLIVERLGPRFAGRKTFIEDFERIVPEFYDLVGANLKTWQAPPPKPVKSRDDYNPGEIEESDLGPAGALPLDQ